MPEWLSLYLVLCWLRFVEHVTWRPAGAVAFRGSIRSCVPAPRDGDTSRGGFILGNPLRPFQGVYVSGTAREGDFDVHELQSRVDSYRGGARALLRAEAALLVHLFLVLPIVWSTIGITRSWPYLLGSLLVLHVVVIATFFHAHGLVFSSSRMERWTAAVPFLLAPPMATAAHLAVTKEIARRVHPVAAAYLLCNDVSFRDLALGYVRRSEFQVADPPPEDRSETPASRSKDLRTLVEERLGPLEGGLQAPARRSDAARTYCPRCLAEYSNPSGTCVDCAGVELKAFAEQPLTSSHEAS